MSASRPVKSADQAYIHEDKKDADPSNRANKGIFFSNSAPGVLSVFTMAGDEGMKGIRYEFDGDSRRWGPINEKRAAEIASIATTPGKQEELRNIARSNVGSLIDRTHLS